MSAGRLIRTLVNPEDQKQVARALNEVLRTLDGGVSFGHPQDPASDTSTTLAGGTSTAHNGVLENINGSWVEIVVDAGGTYTALGAAVTCYHNLNLEIPVSGSPNVRWFVAGASHDGTGTPANANVTVYFQEGDTVAADSIQLRVGATGLTVGDANPLTVTLFFIPAVRFSGA